MITLLDGTNICLSNTFIDLNANCYKFQYTSSAKTDIECGVCDISEGSTTKNMVSL